MRSLLKHWWKAVAQYSQKKIEVRPPIYDEYWKARGRSKPEISPWQKERADLALSFIKEKNEPITITDIGCGNGAVLHYLKSKISNMEGVGVDVSEDSLVYVRDLGFKTLVIDINDVTSTFPKSDYVFLFEIIEHVPQSEFLISKALSSSRKGVFISIPNSGFFTYRLRLLFGKFPAQWIIHPSEHVRFWTLRDVEWWLKALGWDSVSTVKTYQGVPILKNIIPSLFAAGVFIYIKNEENK